MKNEIEILENGNQFYMDDAFTGNSFLFDKGFDQSATIQVIDKNGNKVLSICLWPDDLIALKNFLNSEFKEDVKNCYKQSTLDEDNDLWNVSPSDFNR